MNGNTGSPVLKRLDTWQGLVKGDALHVNGMRGAFSFVAAYARPDGTIDAVQVVGNTQRAGRLRMVAPDRITLFPAKRTRS